MKMKTKNYILMAATIVASILTACQSIELNEEIIDNTINRIQLITEGFDADVATKTSVSGNTVQWDGGEEVYFILYNGQYTEPVKKDIVVNGNKAYIESAPSGSAISVINYPFMAIYPMSIYNSDCISVDLEKNDPIRINVSLPCRYESHYNEGRQVIAVPVAGIAEKDATAIQLKHLTAAVNVTIKNSTGYDLTLDWVEVSSTDQYLSCREDSNPGEFQYLISFNGNPVLNDVEYRHGYGKFVRVQFTDSPTIPIYGGNDANLREVQVPIPPINATRLTIKVHCHTTVGAFYKNANMYAADVQYSFHYDYTPASTLALERNQMATAKIELKRQSESAGKMTEMDHSLFTVARDDNGNPTKQVRFARSNLAYYGSKSEKKWRLMEHPWSTIEANQTEGDYQPTSGKDFSLFGWATSGYSDEGNGGNPWKCDTIDTSYGPAGLRKNYQSWTTNSPNWDWGYYNTHNGNHIYDYSGNTELSGSWHVLSKSETYCIMSTRESNIGGKYCIHSVLPGGIERTSSFAATIEGIKGRVILPDYYYHPDGVPYKAGNSTALSASQWAKMEAAGAIFLPKAGYRSCFISPARKGIHLVNDSGYYWTTDVGYIVSSETDEGDWNLSHAMCFEFQGDMHWTVTTEGRNTGCSVRLVQDAN